MLAGAVHDEGYSSVVSEPLLVRAARREEVERTPVWFMRQAGRSLPEYRAIREKHTFFEVAHTPELCAEVTLQPVRRHDVDAAVMFADIMTPVLGMGVDVRLVEGVGPVIDEPVRTLADVERLRIPDPEEAFAPVLEAVGLVRGALRPDQALIGFCGGPFTVAAYLVEGKPSREFAITKSLMLTQPDVWHALLTKLAETFAGYVAAKVRAGADVIQLFDSWVGALSPSHYREYVGRHSARVLAAVDVPTIHFGTGTATLLEEMAAAGGDVIGLDWRIPLDAGWALVPGRAVQGNLDPAVLLAPWHVVEAEAVDVLARAGGRPGHIFNLGHGVFPSVDPDVLTRLAALVHERTVTFAEATA
jgi:uroporphyrinogen decarboxylase